MENNTQVPKVPQDSIEREAIIDLPDAVSMQEKLVAVGKENYESWERRLFPILVDSAAGRQFVPIGLATVMLSAVRKVVTLKYGKEKSMTSLEGLSMIGNRLPSYVDALVEDPAVAAEVKKEIEGAIPHLDTLFP